MIQATREQVIAFRLASHHLIERCPAGSILAVAGACAIQNTPPGSAGLSLRARVDISTSDLLEQAVHVEKSLLQAWSLRGAPYLFPVADAPVFTRGLLPDSEEARRFFIQGAIPALERLGMSVAEALARTSAALLVVLDGCEISGKRALDGALAAAVASHLSPEQRESWRSPSGYARDQSLGEAVVSFALRLASLQGLVCFAGRRGATDAFARADQWLEHAPPEMGAGQARAELVRRYLHCYGPSGVEHFAAWAGIVPEQARASWALVETELAEVEFGARNCWMLQRDSSDLSSPAVARGARLLPPLDPWVQLRDRATLVSDRDWRAKIWPASGWPGVLLVDGEIAGVWRMKRTRSRLLLRIEPVRDLPPVARAVVEEEAAGLAQFRACDTAEVTFS